MNLSIRRATLCAAFISIVLAGAFGQEQGEHARLERLRGDILGAASATLVLTARCAELHLAEPAVVHAESVPAADAVTAEIRALLRVSASEPVRHRHVRLSCGGHVLSEADNWYVPTRLTVEMNRALDTTDTPFGTVVRPLNFHRRTVETSQSAEGRTVLQVKAVLLTPEELPISLVVENYSRELLGG